MRPKEPLRALVGGLFREICIILYYIQFHIFLFKISDHDCSPPQAAVNYLCCSNVEKGQGATTYTNMLNSNGGSESDLTVSHVEPCPQ